VIRDRIGRLRYQKPALHLDAEGIEASFGRESRTVAAVRVGWRHARAPAPSGRAAGVGNTPPGRCITAPTSIRIASNRQRGSTRRVVEDLRRFYDGTVEA
jgi:hypothetical protein